MLIKKCNGTAEVTFPIAVGTQEAFFVDITKGGITYTPTTPILTTDITAINNYLTVNGLIECVFVSTLINCTFQVTQSVVAYDNVNIVVTDTASPLEPASITGVFSLYGCLWIETAVRGCTDSTAINYNPLATEDNDTCNYEPISDLNKIICCLGKQEYELAIKDKYGLIPVKDRHCKLSQLLFKQKGLEYLQKFIDIGTEIIAGDPIHPAAAAYAIVDMSSLSDDGVFMNTIVEVDGVNIIGTFDNQYFVSLNAYGMALEAAIDAAGLFDADYYPDTDLTYPNTLIITDLTPGAAGNGQVLAISFIQNNIFEVLEIPIISPIAPNTPIPGKGCYDPINNVMIYGSVTAQAPVVDDNVQVDAIDTSLFAGSVAPLYDVAYNPTLELLYIADNIGQGAMIYDINYVSTGFRLLGIGASVHSIFIDETASPAGKIFMGTNTGDIFVFALDHALGMDIIPLATLAPFAAAYEVTNFAKNPVNGMVWVCSGAAGSPDNTIYEIDPDSNTLTGNSFTIPAAVGPTTSPSSAYVISYVLNGVDWECWIAGGTPNIIIIDATDMATIIDVFALPFAGVTHDILQNSVNKYVYVAVISGTLYTLIIDPVTRAISSNTSGSLLKQWTGQKILENPITHKMFISEPGSLTDGLAVQVLDFTAQVFDVHALFIGGLDENLVDVPPVVTEESDNCFTAQEQEDNLTYMVTNNCCEDC